MEDGRFEDPDTGDIGYHMSEHTHERMIGETADEETGIGERIDRLESFEGRGGGQDARGRVVDTLRTV